MASTAIEGPANRFTVDVEDYFHSSLLEGISPPDSWSARELRVEMAAEALLSCLDAHGGRATFFVLGWVARRLAGLVRRIAAAGHEVASHGDGHRRISDLTPEVFREDIRASKALLEDLTGLPVVGYRAPAASLTQRCLWAFDEIHAAGYQYDASVVPAAPGGRSGMPGWPRVPFRIERLGGGRHGNWVPEEEPGGSSPDEAPPPRLLEVPVTTWDLVGLSVPIGRGSFLRLLPYRWLGAAFRRLQAAGRPLVLQVRLWEFDPGQPRLTGGGLAHRAWHYQNLGATRGTVERLLRDFPFTLIRDGLARKVR